MIEIDIFGGKIDQLSSLKKALDKAISNAFQNACKRLLVEGVQLANQNAKELVLGDGVYNQEFEDAVVGNRKRRTKLNKYSFEGEIYNPTEDSAYAEFGTGLVGIATPHMVSTPSGWEYAMNPDRDYSYGWTYYGDGEFYHTYGLPSSQYMYTTGTQLPELFNKIYNEELEKELAKVVL